jgi:hypothetical protein
MIYHDTTEGFADVGIAIETCPDGQVYNNTIYHEHSYLNAIEYRFAATTNAFIANNLTNKNIQARDGASGIDTSNVTNAQAGWFVDIPTGDLHLDYAVTAVVDQGIAITGLTHDFDGDPRPQGAGYDIGCDEYTGTGLEDDTRSMIHDAGYKLTVQPNPFSYRINIRFSIYDTGYSMENLTLEIYDISGRLVKSFNPISSIPGLAPRSGAGENQGSSISWNGRDDHNRKLGDGVYFVRLQTPNFDATRSVIILR